MLVLSRKPGEEIVLETERGVVSVRVVRVESNRDGRSVVRLGFSAPQEIAIDRAEVRARIEEATREP